HDTPQMKQSIDNVRKRVSSKEITRRIKQRTRKKNTRATSRVDSLPLTDWMMTQSTLAPITGTRKISYGHERMMIESCSRAIEASLLSSFRAVGPRLVDGTHSRQLSPRAR